MINAKIKNMQPFLLATVRKSLSAKQFILKIKDTSFYIWDAKIENKELKIKE